MAAGALMGAAMGAQAIGGAVSAMGTLAGGSYARTAGLMQQSADDYQAAQLREDSGTAIGVAQEKMLDRQFNTRMILSTLRARAAGGGVSTASPTVAEDAGAIAGKGRFDSLMDLWQGKNQATGMINQAKGLEYSGDIAAYGGEMQAEASKYAAVATLASAAGGMARTYGAFAYPDTAGRPGAGFTGRGYG